MHHLIMSPHIYTHKVLKFLMLLTTTIQNIYMMNATILKIIIILMLYQPKNGTSRFNFTLSMTPSIRKNMYGASNESPCSSLAISMARLSSVQWY